jgi:hypothetical protein
MTPEGKCENCRYWFRHFWFGPDPPTEEITLGICYARPPTAYGERCYHSPTEDTPNKKYNVHTFSFIRGEWPSTYGEEWCGAFEWQEEPCVKRSVSYHY